MRITVLAIGKTRGAQGDLCADYSKRITCAFSVRELQTQTQKAENVAILAALPPKAFVVLMDERGKDLTSREFAQKIASWQDQGAQDIYFIIGGADGVTDEIRSRADYTMSLGHKTWPHLLARVMLIEQIYRAQQINSGHPYHRD